MSNKIERHPFTPFLPENARLVMCGTFPPKPDKWAMNFFYPNFINDMWRIFGIIFYDDKNRFFNLEEKTIRKADIQETLASNQIGLCETAREVIRTKDNASDKFLEIVTPIDFSEILPQIPDCHDIATTGEKAASVIASLTNTEIPKMGEYKDCETIMADGSKRRFRHWRMPSTSRAYPMKLEEKTAYYRNLFISTGIIKEKTANDV